MATIATLTQKADGNLEGTLTHPQHHRPHRDPPQRAQGEGQRARLSRRLPQERLRTGRRLEPDLEEHRRGIHLDLALGAGVRDHLRQRRPGPRRRRDEEGHHLEPGERLTTARPRELAGPVVSPFDRASDRRHGPPIGRARRSRRAAHLRYSRRSIAAVISWPFRGQSRGWSKPMHPTEGQRRGLRCL